MEFQFYPVTKMKIYEKVLKNPDIIGFLSVQKKVSQTQLSRKNRNLHLFEKLHTL